MIENLVHFAMEEYTLYDFVFCSYMGVDQLTPEQALDQTRESLEGGLDTQEIKDLLNLLDVFKTDRDALALFVALVDDHDDHKVDLVNNKYYNSAYEYPNINGVAAVGDHDVDNGIKSLGEKRFGGQLAKMDSNIEKVTLRKYKKLLRRARKLLDNLSDNASQKAGKSTNQEVLTSIDTNGLDELLAKPSVAGVADLFEQNDALYDRFCALLQDSEWMDENFSSVQQVIKYHIVWSSGYTEDYCNQAIFPKIEWDNLSVVDSTSDYGARQTIVLANLLYIIHGTEDVLFQARYDNLQDKNQKIDAAHSSISSLSLTGEDFSQDSYDFVAKIEQYGFDLFLRDVLQEDESLSSRNPDQKSERLETYMMILDQFDGYASANRTSQYMQELKQKGLDTIYSFVVGSGDRDLYASYMDILSDEGIDLMAGTAVNSQERAIDFFNNHVKDMINGAPEEDKVRASFEKFKTVFDQFGNEQIQLAESARLAAQKNGIKNMIDQYLIPFLNFFGVVDWLPEIRSLVGAIDPSYEKIFDDLLMLDHQEKKAVTTIVESYTEVNNPNPGFFSEIITEGALFDTDILATTLQGHIDLFDSDLLVSVLQDEDFEEEYGIVGNDYIMKEGKSVTVNYDLLTTDNNFEPIINWILKGNTGIMESMKIHLWKKHNPNADSSNKISTFYNDRNEVLGLISAYCFNPRSLYTEGQTWSLPVKPHQQSEERPSNQEVITPKQTIENEINELQQKYTNKLPLSEDGKPLEPLPLWYATVEEGGESDDESVGNDTSESDNGDGTIEESDTPLYTVRLRVKRSESWEEAVIGLDAGESLTDAIDGGVSFGSIKSDDDELSPMVDYINQQQYSALDVLSDSDLREQLCNDDNLFSTYKGYLISQFASLYGDITESDDTTMPSFFTDNSGDGEEKELFEKRSGSDQYSLVDGYDLQVVQDVGTNTKKLAFVKDEEDLKEGEETETETEAEPEVISSIALGDEQLSEYFGSVDANDSFASLLIGGTAEGGGGEGESE